MVYLVLNSAWFFLRFFLLLKSDNYFYLSMVLYALNMIIFP